MIDIPLSAKENIKKYENCFAIGIASNGRWNYSLFTMFFFILLFVGFLSLMDRIITVEFYIDDLYGLTLEFIGASLFGYMSLTSIWYLIQLPEVLLYPKQKKIVIRRERDKKIISEHSIDNIEHRVDKVMHADPARIKML